MDEWNEVEDEGNGDERRKCDDADADGTTLLLLLKMLLRLLLLLGATTGDGNKLIQKNSN